MVDMGIHLAVSRLGAAPTMDLMRTVENTRARLSGDPNAGNILSMHILSTHTLSINPLNTHPLNTHPRSIIGRS